MVADHWMRVERALDAALESDPALWPAVLDETCGEDEEVRREVEDLLARYRTAQRFLESPPAAAAAALVAEAQDASGTAVGRRIGAYRLVREIGRGGMARVFLAERADGQFSQRVALKLLRPGLDTELDRARFRAERQILASFSHPNIARLLDGGVTDGGAPYLVLEHVDGRPIDRYCEERRLPLRARIELFLTVAEATQHAHRNLVIHRDLKPSNIFVTANGAVKLLDFGLARLLDPEEDPASRLTRTGQRWMTPEYAAPEQILGEPATTVTDVYQLGAVLYELLAGCLPFPPAAGGRRQLEAAILRRDPVPPSAAAAQPGSRVPEPGAGRALRGDLDAIVLKAMSKEPDRRYASAAALREDLERHLAGRPVRARAYGSISRLRRFVRRNVEVAMATGLTAVALLAATGFSLHGMRVARRERDVAALERQRATAQADFESLLLSEVGDRPVAMREVLDSGRVLLERRYARDPALLGAMLMQLESRYGELGDTKVRGELLAHAERLALAGTGEISVARVRCEIADNLRLDGSYDAAWRTLNAADSLLGGHPDPRDLAGCLSVRATLGLETGRERESVGAARRAIAIKEALGQTVDLEYIGLLNALAAALDGVGQPRNAVAMYQRLVATLDSSGRGGSLQHAIVRHDLAITLLELGETAEAERILHDALVRSLSSDPGGRIIYQPAIHYAEAALAQEHPDSALEYFGRILAQATTEGSQYWQGRGLFGLARAQIRLGRLAEANRTSARFARVAAGYPKLKGTDDLVPDTGILAGLRAVAAGDTAAARADLLEALRSNGYFRGEHRRRLRPAVVLLAECDLALGRRREALSLAREVRAVAAVDSLADARSAYVGEARLVEARALLALADSAGARETLARALVALRSGAGAGHPRTREAAALAARIAKPAPAGDAGS